MLPTLDGLNVDMITPESLHDQLAKAQRTIKVQSDQIASPNEKKSRRTPSRATPSSRQNVDFQQPPPPFQTPQRRPTSAYSQQPTSTLGYPPPPPAQPTSYPYHSSQSSTTLQSAFHHPQTSLRTPPLHQYLQQDPQELRQHAATPVGQSSTSPPLTGGGSDPTTGGPSGRVMRLPGRSSREKEVYRFLTPSGEIVETRREEGW